MTSHKSTARAGWKGTFKAVMKQHNPYTADGGKVVSYATQKQRRDVLLQGFRVIRSHGFKFKTVQTLRTKHIECLVRHWETTGLSAATIQNRLSIFRTFATWIGKDGLVRPAEHYLQDKTRAKRSYIAFRAKITHNQGVDSG